MSIKKYSIFCEICGYHRITDGSSPEDKDLIEIKRGKVQRNIPKLNEEGKVEDSLFFPQPKMFKCPSCGRGVRVKKIKNQSPEP